MPSTAESVDRPADAVAVAQRYHRLERLSTVGFAAAVVVGVLAAVISLPTLPGLAVAAVAAVLVRFPTLRTSGTARLVTDADPETVIAAFSGPTPPVLALQWGVADSVHETDDGGEYEITYLFGLRSVTMRTETQVRDDTVALTVRAGGRPWGSYTTTIQATDEGTAVTVEWTSDRRFGLRRLPQWVVAERFRVPALAAQGYSVTERDAGLSI